LQAIPSGHQDVIQDLSFNLYGNRLVTSSNDGKLTFYQKDSKTKWIKQIEKETNDFVTKVKWAHPAFGNIVAACTLNRSIILF
jgi:nucleoporin SEH1